jgi:hypothetical protein
MEKDQISDDIFRNRNRLRHLGKEEILYLPLKRILKNTLPEIMERLENAHIGDLHDLLSKGRLYVSHIRNMGDKRLMILDQDIRDVGFILK